MKCEKCEYCKEKGRERVAVFREHVCHFSVNVRKKSGNVRRCSRNTRMLFGELEDAVQGT
jgi:hypothetical protein